MPDPGAGLASRRFLHGARAALSGFGFALRHGRVLSLCLAAMVVYAAVWGVMLWLASHYDARFAQAVLWQPTEAWWDAALWQITRVGAYVLFWVGAIAVAMALAMPVLSPLFSLLADRVDASYHGDDGAPMPPLPELLAEMLRGFGRALVLVAIQLGGSVGLWLAGLVLSFVVPPLGPIFTVLVGGSWNALWVAMTLSGFALENNRVDLRTQIGLLRGQLAQFVGFGVVAQVLAWLPFSVPFLVVAATLLVCRLHDHGHCPLPVRSKLQS